MHVNGWSVWSFPSSRIVENCILQLQKTDEDVEGREEEAVGLSDVLTLSVYQELVRLCYCQSWQSNAARPFLNPI